MVVKDVGALILRTNNPEKLLKFYTTLGLEFELEEHDEGPKHWACEFSGVHMAIFSTKANPASDKLKFDRTLPGTSQIGFVVESVDETYKRLKHIDAKSIWEPTDAHWGRTAMVYDPDGRPVEFFERN